MKTLLVMMTLLFSTFTFADEPVVKCTLKPREAWSKIDEVRKGAERKGYKIKKYTTLEYCYLFEGTDKAGKEVKLYVNPENGKFVNPYPML